MSIFNFFSQFGKSKGAEETKQVEKKEESFAPPREDDTIIVNSGGVIAQPLSLEDNEKQTESDLINSWRELAARPEIDWAIQEIINEAIVTDFNDYPVSLTLPEDIELPDKIKDVLIEEFNTVLRLMNFNRSSTEKFRQWYVDGKHYYHGIVDSKHPSNGLIAVRWIDPRSIKKVIETEVVKNEQGIEVEKFKDSYFVYTNYSSSKNNYANVSRSRQAIKVHPDSVAYSNSGLFQEKRDGKGTVAISHLNKALKSANQLQLLEDAVVIYRLSRAPERRIFYVDVGNLPKTKADQYLTGIMNRFKNKMVYDSATGEVKTTGNNLSMLEDYWLPRREGGRGTEVTTLQGGQNLGELSDVDYFYRKLFRSLNIPSSRLQSESTFNLGRSAEITREEVKFTKFINYLRTKFSEVFVQLLKIQVITKNIMSVEDFDEVSPDFVFKWETDAYWDELMFAEMMQSRLNLLRDIDQYRGEYFSKEWINKNVLQLSEEEVREMDKQIKKEPAPEPEDDGRGNRFR